MEAIEHVEDDISIHDSRFKSPKYVPKFRIAACELVTHHTKACELSKVSEVEWREGTWFGKPCLDNHSDSWCNATNCILFPDILHRATARRPLSSTIPSLCFRDALNLAPAPPLLPLQDGEHTLTPTFSGENPEHGFKDSQLVEVLATTHSIAPLQPKFQLLSTETATSELANPQQLPGKRKRKTLPGIAVNSSPEPADADATRTQQRKQIGLLCKALRKGGLRRPSGRVSSTEASVGREFVGRKADSPVVDIRLRRPCSH